MSFGFVDEHRHIWPVRTICAVLGISASGYYAWRGRPESRRSVENRALLDDIRQTHAESGGCYGAPHPCGIAGCRPADRTTSYRASDAACRHARAGGDPAPGAHDGQPTRLPDRAEQAAKELHGYGAEPGMAR